MRAGLPSFLLLFPLAGCATLTPEGERVRITRNTQATAGCKFLGNVKGKFDNDLRNEAAKLGADLVYNETQPNEPHIWQRGEAYRCQLAAGESTKGGIQ